MVLRVEENKLGSPLDPIHGLLVHQSEPPPSHGSFVLARRTRIYAHCTILHWWTELSQPKLAWAHAQVYSRLKTFQVTAELALCFFPFSNNVLLMWNSFLRKCKSSITFTAVTLLFMIRLKWKWDTCHLKIDSLETWSGFDSTNAISGLVPGLIERCDNKIPREFKILKNFWKKLWNILRNLWNLKGTYVSGNKIKLEIIIL